MNGLSSIALPFRSDLIPFAGSRAERPTIPVRDLADSDLLELALEGREKAFREIVERYVEDVSRTATGMLGATAEVDDVVQDVFIRLHGSLANFRGESSLKTYLIRVTINRSLDVLRKRKRRKWLTPWQDLGDAEPIADETADSDLDTSDRNRMLRAAIDRLPENQRSVVILRWIEELSTEETAAVLGVPYGTVLSRLKRALDRLKVEMGDHFSLGEDGTGS